MRLGDRYTFDELDLLIRQTLELRRDPKEREKENAEKALDKWIAENQDRQIEVLDNNGNLRTIDMSKFSFN